MRQHQSSLINNLQIAHQKKSFKVLLVICTLFIQYMKSTNSKISLDDFVLLTVIGKGTFGKVLLVKKKDDDHRVFAMKILKKKYLSKNKQESQAMIQRDILVEADNPFVVKLYYTFQNQKRLFFVMDYCPGGQFYNLLCRKRKFPEHRAKFYASQIFLAIQYLHSKGIIYQDLKPENILIDRKGYLLLADFGLSKIINKNTDEKGRVGGTAEYLAPQILLKKQYQKPIDWWCLGNLIYEMIFGLPPFYSSNKSELNNKILNNKPYFPAQFSSQLSDLLCRLLEKDPEKRLGSMKGAIQIKQHPWFSSIDWKGIQQKTLKAPFVPRLKSEVDVSNFDCEFTQCSIQSDTEAEKSEVEEVYIGFSYNRSDQRTILQQTPPILNL